MKGRVFRAIAVGFCVAALAPLVARLPVEALPPTVASSRSWPTEAFSVLMLVLAAANWLAPGLGYHALQRDPRVTALRDQVIRFVLTASGTTGIAFLGALCLVGYRLADGGGLIVLTAAEILFPSHRLSGLATTA